jgi:hypothetical protein
MAGFARISVVPEVQRAVVGPHPLQPPDQYPEAGGVEEPDLVQVDDELVAALAAVIRTTVGPRYPNPGRPSPILILGLLPGLDVPGFDLVQESAPVLGQARECPADPVLGVSHQDVLPVAGYLDALVAIDARPGAFPPGERVRRTAARSGPA